MPDTQKKQYADCIVWNDKNEFLILLRSRDDDFEPGKWGLPGGKIEDGEEPYDAALRELLEETGIYVKVATLNTVKESDESSIYYYTVHSNEDPKVLDTEEHINYKWIRPEDIYDYTFLMDLQETLEKIFSLPESIGAFKTIKKAFNEGNEISEDSYLNALSKYNEVVSKLNYDTIFSKNFEKAVYTDNKLNTSLKRSGKEYNGKKKPAYKIHEYHGKNINYDIDQESFVDEDGNILDSQKANDYIDLKLKHDAYQIKKREIECMKGVMKKVSPYFFMAKKLQNSSDSYQGDLRSVFDKVIEEKLGKSYLESYYKEIDYSYKTLCEKVN